MKYTGILLMLACAFLFTGCYGPPPKPVPTNLRHEWSKWKDWKEQEAENIFGGDLGKRMTQRQDCTHCGRALFSTSMIQDIVKRERCLKRIKK